MTLRALPLPVRDGVGPSCVVLPAGDWPTVLDYFVHRFTAVTRAQWQSRMGAGEVVDAHGVPITETRRFEAQLRIYYYRQLDSEPRVPFEEQVLFHDEHLLAVDKPHFLSISPVGKYVQETLLVRLKRKLGIDELVPLHRIDRETAGVVLFSVQRASRGAYVQLFAERMIEKRYEAIVHRSADFAPPAVRVSRLEDDDTHFMRMREVPGEPNAKTRIEVLGTGTDWAHLSLSPVTGRRHQLRVHCQALGMPIRNDAIYPVLRPEGCDDYERPLQLLARELRFRDPLSGVERFFASKRSLALPPR
ncbi:tRNA pseudouridine32 synthase / 23S rRNA pseudouridine746 synthase [Variovorax sp. HW608]|uniref:pseudouridine synthase n=1 Tax=Variovorax sp. HW608 TaxID=1034889 RepID=UPI00082004B0|nr:pseudouridine synthase [Variovorax sp. HW608]SCK40753.1 tRNA pseudouridine32 synthase / 23S rRNA pseudouridine746 synthase [Variovorax sp. HW608]